MAPQRLLSFSKMNVPSSVTALGKSILLATDPDLVTYPLVFFLKIIFFKNLFFKNINKILIHFKFNNNK